MDKLSRYAGAPALTIYMPLQSPTAKGSTKQENLIRLKNLVKEVEGRIEEYEGQHREHRQELLRLLKPLRDALEGGGHFWDPQAASTAIFLAPDFSEVIPLQVPVGEDVFIGDRFHLKPLFSARSRSAGYYLVSLDLKDVKLYRGNRFKLQEVPLASPPKALPQILEEFDFERSLNKAPGGDTIYVGHQGGEENLTPHIVEFLQGVDHSVRETIGDSESPVLLAGTENVVGHFRHRSALSTLQERHVAGSPRSFTVAELHDRSWEIVSALTEKRLTRELDSLKEGLDSSQGLREMEEICAAAFEGRVQLLFVAEDSEVRGSFRETEEELELTEEGEDMLEWAAHYAWTRGSRVYAVAQKRIPGGRPAAALVHRSE